MYVEFTVYDSWGVQELQHGICGLWEQRNVSVAICVSCLLQDLHFVGVAVLQCGGPGVGVAGIVGFKD